MSLQHHNVVIVVSACVGLTATTSFHDFQQVVLAYKLLMGFSENNQLESFNQMKKLFKCFEKLKTLTICKLKVEHFMANAVSCFVDYIIW